MKNTNKSDCRDATVTPETTTGNGLILMSTGLTEQALRAAIGDYSFESLVRCVDAELRTAPLASDKEEAHNLVRGWLQWKLGNPEHGYQDAELVMCVAALIGQVREAQREVDAVIAEDPMNIIIVGGSTGSAHLTSKRIAAAIRSEGTQ